MKVVVNYALSIDGMIDEAKGSQSKVLSSVEDFQRVDELRGISDAILIGANTVRRDNPRLTVKDPSRIQRRLDRGAPSQPIKVAVTLSGDLFRGETGEENLFFSEGEGRKLLFVPLDKLDDLNTELRSRNYWGVEVVPLPLLNHGTLNAREMCSELERRGVRQLLIEGGASTIEWAVRAGVVDELNVAIAPEWVGKGGGVGGPDLSFLGRLPIGGVDRLGDMAILRFYLGGER